MICSHVSRETRSHSRGEGRVLRWEVAHRRVHAEPGSGEVLDALFGDGARWRAKGTTTSDGLIMDRPLSAWRVRHYSPSGKASTGCHPDRCVARAGPDHS